MNLDDMVTLLLVEEAKKHVEQEPVRTYYARRDAYITKRKREIADILVEASR